MKKRILLGMIIFLSAFHSAVNAKAVDRVFVKGSSSWVFNGKKANITSFEITKFEITNEAYAAFLTAKQIGADGISKGKALINIGSSDLQLEFKNKGWYAKQGYGHFPVVMVSYYGAVEFCNWAGGRLPTDAEWAYAASGGTSTKQYLFAGGNQYEKVGWYNANSQGRLHKGGEKQPNQLGIYDMSGNAWEWCLNSTTVSDTSFCIHMGGSWYAGEQPGRLDARYGNTPTHFSNSVGFRVVFVADAFLSNKKFFRNYQGKPWNNQPQQIPGTMQCEWYDLGGEGIAYHDVDSINNGSGRLNPANGTYLNEFRINEGVDISYTKSRDIDNSPYNMVEPVMDQLYAGWTVPGEWINYTVNIAQTGNYSIGLMYTASGDGGIGLLMDGKQLTKELFIPSTRHEKESIPWRQWHHWNKIDSLATVQLKKGIHVLTFKTVTNGNMNYDYLEFKLK
jgi:Sulfatase-modifying factor enzyme 1